MAESLAKQTVISYIMRNNLLRMMTRNLPSLNALRAFEAAARHNSFTSAAAELHVTHAAISRHVRELESWMGAKLFRRLGRGVDLTDAGKAYRRRLTKIFDDLAAATAAAKKALSAAQLTVSVESAFAARWLVPRLGRFHAAHPDIELTLDVTDDRVNFRSDPAELAIRYGEGKWDDVDVTLLSELTTSPVCSPALLNGETLETPSDVAKFPLIHEETKDWWTQWLEEFGGSGAALETGLIFRNSHLAIEAAEAGQGFVLGDNLLVADAIASGKLVRPFDAEWDCGGYYIVRPENGEESAAAAAFRTWLQAEIAS